MKKLKRSSITTACPKCYSKETRQVTRFGRPLGDQWQCFKCRHRWDLVDAMITTAPSRDDGKPGGPGEGGSVSSPLSVGPPGAVTFPLARLCLDVAVDLNMEVPRGLADEISRIFADWNDGRKPFSVEAVERGLTEIVASAAYHAIEREFRKLSNAMVKTGPNSETAWSVVKAEGATREMRVRIQGDVSCLSVSESER